MRAFALFTLAALLFLFGCSPPPPPAPASRSVTPVLELRQVMEWVIDPAADVIWDAVKSITTEAGTKEIAPQTDEQWAAVRNASATLIEAGNMLMLEGRARDQKDWMGGARGLVKTGTAALKAAEAKDKDAVFAAGGEIYTVCKGCHQLYASHLNSAASPVRMAIVAPQRGWAHWPDK
ncbi:MAG TPA: hypothetical protein VGO08_04665 [Burkholderiales bacterium]|nr:hypothetical protein [Burkholderiales bacterium]